MESGGGQAKEGEWDVLLLAKLLIGLSQPEFLVPPPPPPLPPPPELKKWQRNGPRSRTIKMEGAEATRVVVPVPPPSWSGGGDASAATAGSPCFGRPLPGKKGLQKRKRKTSLPPSASRKKRIRVSPETEIKLEIDRSAKPYPTNKMEEVAVAAAAAEGAPPASSLPAGRVPPLRLKLPPEAMVSAAGAVRPRKKKTLPERRAMEEALQRERESLRKEIEARKMACTALLEENSRLELRVLQSGLPPAAAESAPTPSAAPSEGAELDLPRAATSAAPPAPAASLLDLRELRGGGCCILQYARRRQRCANVCR